MKQSDIERERLFDQLLSSLEKQFRRGSRKVSIIFVEGQTREEALAEYQSKNPGWLGEDGYTLVMDFGSGQETPFSATGEGGSFARVPPRGL